jgi:hypothetical protein
VTPEPHILILHPAALRQPSTALTRLRDELRRLPPAERDAYIRAWVARQPRQPPPPWETATPAGLDA